MVSQIVHIISLVLIYILAAIAYMILISRILPHMLLKPSKKNARQTARGIKKYTFENGRAIVYETSGNVAKYLTQYILSENSGDKFIKCKADKRINTIRYTVIAMDAYDRIIDIIEVDEHVSGRGYTEAIVLPNDTSYVSLSIDTVNGYFPDDRTKILISGTMMLVYIGAVALINAAVSAKVFSMMRDAWDTFIQMNVTDKHPAMQASLLIGALMGAVYASLICLSYVSSGAKIPASRSLTALWGRITGRAK